jgi:hypothetical protein
MPVSGGKYSVKELNVFECIIFPLQSFRLWWRAKVIKA